MADILRPGRVSVKAFADGFAGPAVETPFAFLEQLQRPLTLWTVADSYALRGIILALHFGLAISYTTCWNKRCGGAVCLRDRSQRSGVRRYAWTCQACLCTKGVQGVGPLAHIRQNHWAAFFYFLSFLVIDIRWTVILGQLHRTFGVTSRCNKWVPQWLTMVQQHMHSFMAQRGHYVLGDSRSVIVVDETAFGKAQGVSKRPCKPSLHRRALAKQRIKRKLPARTVWTKKGEQLTAGTKQRLAMKKPGPQRNSRTQWVWVATLVGRKDGTSCTHGNGLKRVVLKMLPPAHNAIQGKPRGEQELKKLFRKHTKRGAVTVTDKWPGPVAALRRLGRSKDHHTVDHSNEWRSQDGWHTNDAESENSRIKCWARGRYGKLPRLTEGLLQEYTFGVNVGREFGKIVQAVSSDGTGHGLPPACDQW